VRRRHDGVFLDKRLVVRVHYALCWDFDAR
jgi:hypothetical protein